MLPSRQTGAFDKSGQSAFTLLEMIIVIIIIGVLAALALPRFLSVIEEARATEAINAIGAIRQAMERCYLMHNGTYLPCKLNEPNPGDTSLDLEDPGTSANAHFTYSANGADLFYIITALRNTRDGGPAGAPIDFSMGCTISVMKYGGGYMQAVTCDGVPQFHWAAADIYQGALPP